MIEQLQELGLSSEAQALAQGMLLGDKSALPMEMIRDFRTAGMSHILAVSGLHIGIIMSVIWMLLKPVEWLVLLTAPVRMRTYYLLGDAKRLLTIVVTVVYVWYIGAPPSAVRAAIMLSLCLVGWMLHRPTSAWRCLLLAALVLLAWDPWTITTPGFQLSFLAVAGILLFQPWLQSETLPWWLRVILLSVAAQWFTTPIVAYWFHQVPVFGCIQGLLVVPILPFFVGLLLVGMLFPAWSCIAVVVNALTNWMGWVAHAIGSLEKALLGGHLYLYGQWWEIVLSEVFLLAVVLYLRMRASQPLTVEERKEELKKKYQEQQR